MTKLEFLTVRKGETVEVDMNMQIVNSEYDKDSDSWKVLYYRY